MPIVKNLAFVIDRFELGSPAQQLLDRFLIGYQRDGNFISTEGRKITVPAGLNNELLQKRVADFGLGFHDNIESADAIVMIQPATQLPETMNAARQGTPIFVYGVPSRKTLIEVLRPTRVVACLMCGTVTATALRQPEIKVTGRPREALIVVQGSAPEAELMALDGILPLVEGEVVRARYLKGAAVWDAGEKREWSWTLLKSALSRSDSPQGNTVLDGRSDDHGKLAPTLATSPRGWMLDHQGGARTTLLVLDGVIADTVLALNAGGKIISAQLFRAPSPAREDYSRLVAAISDFFLTGKSNLKLERSILEARLLEHFVRDGSRNGQWQNVIY